MSEIRTPDCPVCSQPPVIVIPGSTQAFCGNGDCNVLMWNPSKSIDDNLLDAGFVDLLQQDGSDEGSGE